MDSPYAQIKGEKIVTGDLSPQFSLTLATKDVGLALEMAAAAGVDLGLAPQTFQRFRRAIELGHGDEDMAAAWFATRTRSD
jgi:3-hydroxyisobutyrate dehydrogenase